MQLYHPPLSRRQIAHSCGKEMRSHRSPVQPEDILSAGRLNGLQQCSSQCLHIPGSIVAYFVYEKGWSAIDAAEYAVAEVFAHSLDVFMNPHISDKPSGVQSYRPCMFQQIVVT